MQLFRIGELADMLAVPTHTIRYWESQIPILFPRHRLQSQRAYTLDDVRHFFRIRHLIVDKQYNIQETCQVLFQERAQYAGIIKAKCEEIKANLLLAAKLHKQNHHNTQKIMVMVKELQHLIKE